MEKMKQDMENAMQEMEEKEEEENAAALRQILENLLNLSFAQEELVKALPKTRIDNPQYIKIPQQQKKLQDDAKIIEGLLRPTQELIAFLVVFEFYLDIFSK